MISEGQKPRIVIEDSPRPHREFISEYLIDPSNPEQNIAFWKGLFEHRARLNGKTITELELPEMDWTREEIEAPFPTMEGGSPGFMIPDFIPPTDEGFQLLGTLVDPGFRAVSEDWLPGTFTHREPTYGWVKVDASKTAGNLVTGEEGEIEAMLNAAPGLVPMPATVYALFALMHLTINGEYPDPDGGAYLSGTTHKGQMAIVAASIPYEMTESHRQPVIITGNSGGLSKGMGVRFMQQSSQGSTNS